MIHFLLNLEKNGAIIAYVTQATPPKKISKNYLSLLISHSSYDNLSDQTEKFHCYHFDSLLTHQRQYKALKASSDINLTKYLTDPLTYTCKDLTVCNDFSDIFSDNFNESQIATLQKVSNTPANQVCLILGPPGSGKTHTIRGIVSMIYKPCKRILICTPSNKAVDEILNRLSSKGLLGTDLDEKHIVRVGGTEY